MSYSSLGQTTSAPATPAPAAATGATVNWDNVKKVALAACGVALVLVMLRGTKTEAWLSEKSRGLEERRRRRSGERWY